MTRGLISLLVIAVLTSCATDVFGPYASSVSAHDIQQIKALIATRPDIHKFILRIVTTRPNCVYVETAPTAIDQPSTSFTACKRDDTWHINENHVKEWRTIVTD